MQLNCVRCKARGQQPTSRFRTDCSYSTKLQYWAVSCNFTRQSFLPGIFQKRTSCRGDICCSHGTTKQVTEGRSLLSGDRKGRLFAELASQIGQGHPPIDARRLLRKHDCEVRYGQHPRTGRGMSMFKYNISRWSGIGLERTAGVFKLMRCTLSRKEALSKTSMGCWMSLHSRVDLD